MKKQPEKKPAKSGHELLEKMGQLIEEQPEASAPPAQEPPGEKPTSPNRNRALMTYIAFLIQQKDSRQTISELNQNANSALSRAEQLQDNNRELLEANQALQDQVVQLQADLDETSKNYSQLEETNTSLQESHAALQAQCTKQEQQVQAYELLLSAQRALDQEDTEEFLTAMKDLKPLAENLDAEGKTLYQELLPLAVEPQENTRETNP